MNRNRLALTLGILVTLAGGGAYLAHRSGAPLGRSMLGAGDRNLRFAINLPRGTEYVYAVAWRSTSDLDVPELRGSKSSQDGFVHATVDLAGELSLRSYGLRDGAFVVGVRLASITRHELSVLGENVLKDDATARDAFEGREAIAEIEPSGAVRAVRFRKEDPAVFKQTMRALLTEAQMHVLANGQARWTTPEVSGTGVATVRYEVEETDPPRITRYRDRVASVAALPGRAITPADVDAEGSTSITLEPAGHVRELAEHDRLRVKSKTSGRDSDFRSETSLTLRLAAVRPFDAGGDPDLTAMEMRVPGQVDGPSADVERQLLEQRIGGLTFDAMKSDLETFALGGSLPSSRWLLQASGLLKLNPGRCLDLAAMFEAPAMTARGRTQILDLLAGTGTPQAQDAMRVALESPAARAPGQPYGALLQRFSAVGKPTRESLDFVAREYKTAAGDERYAAAYALGSTAGNATKRGDAVAGKAASATLRRDLENARTPRERKELATALGNAGDADNVRALSSLAGDDDAGVRAAAAWALHRNDDEDARAALVTLATDADSSVAESALQAMSYQHLEAPDLQRLAAAVTRGATAPLADGALLTLLTGNVAGGTPVREMLGTLLARNDADHEMQGRIRHVIAQLQ